MPNLEDYFGYCLTTIFYILSLQSQKVKTFNETHFNRIITHSIFI